MNRGKVALKEERQTPRVSKLVTQWHANLKWWNQEQVGSKFNIVSLLVQCWKYKRPTHLFIVLMSFQS